MKSNRKNNIQLTDVVKMRQGPAFATMVKPVGATCNLNCSYCYYKDKAELYTFSSSHMFMSDEVLRLYIEQYLGCLSQPVATFCWHGGEPLLAGLDFFRRAMMYQQRYCGDKKIENTLQTNGVLINDDWCRFFKDNNFLVGISLDGPSDVHDAYRCDCGGAPTFEKVIAAIELMRNCGVEYNILTTINSESEGRGGEVYRFLRGMGDFIQFLPVVEHVQSHTSQSRRSLIVSPDDESGRQAQWSVSATAFGQFMCDVFDEWVINDVGRCYVQLFDVTLANWCGVAPSLCAFCETCGDAPVVEHNGDVYSCDHFVYPEYRLGNITICSLAEMYNSEEHRAFGRDKREALPMECKRCTYKFLCRGECPKHRFDKAGNGEPYKNSLCEGYKMFFRHSDLYMRYMRTMLEKGRSPMEVMNFARQRRNL